MSAFGWFLLPPSLPSKPLLHLILHARRTKTYQYYVLARSVCLCVHSFIRVFGTFSLAIDNNMVAAAETVIRT